MLKVLIVVVVIVAMFVIVVALQPSEFRVARTARMSAPPATVFAQVNDLRKMQAWSPWARMDMSLRRHKVLINGRVDFAPARSTAW